MEKIFIQVLHDGILLCQVQVLLVGGNALEDAGLLHPGVLLVEVVVLVEVLVVELSLMVDKVPPGVNFNIIF